MSISQVSLLMVLNAGLCVRLQVEGRMQIVGADGAEIAMYKERGMTFRRCTVQKVVDAGMAMMLTSGLLVISPKGRRKALDLMMLTTRQIDAVV